jgi:hypothetical protein
MYVLSRTEASRKVIVTAAFCIYKTIIVLLNLYRYAGAVLLNPAFDDNLYSFSDLLKHGILSA